MMFIFNAIPHRLIPNASDPPANGIYGFRFFGRRLTSWTVKGLLASSSA
jgi:hypothetical protein